MLQVLALTRPARFDRIVEVPAPDEVGRAAILAVHSAGIRLHGDVRLSYYAQVTKGFTGADLATVMVCYA